jgi:formylglycine-generating enzyme required for sulfatase activity
MAALMWKTPTSRTVSLLLGVLPLWSGAASAQAPVSAERAEMVLIPAGHLSRSIGGRAPPRKIEVAAFKIDIHEVSVADYRACVEAGPCRPAAFEDPTSSFHLQSGKRESASLYVHLVGPDQPIVGVSWKDARAYCHWRGKRLPTEAEWERAFRGDDARTYPWGDEPPTCERANFTRGTGSEQQRCHPGTLSVTALPAAASPFGVLHLAGNVSEWVQDWFAAPTPHPQGPSRGKQKVVRGGSWVSEAHELSASSRRPMEPSARFHFLGFRCAQTPVPPGGARPRPPPGG